MALPTQMFVGGKSLFIAIIFIFTNQVLSANDKFNEELFIKPLQSGHVYYHFQFTTDSTVDFRNRSETQHFHLFPKSLGEVLAAYSVQELHLSLTQGLWRYEKWGYPIQDAPPGAELWVWFQEGTANVDQTWTDLINVLSGMFCASLNFMDAKTTVTPKLSLRPQGVASDGYGKPLSDLVRYAMLPKEIVCTENLTPWKKLLPCGGHAGLSILFAALKLYDSSYHSLGVHLRPVCRDEKCMDISLELSQSLSVVFEPTLPMAGKQDWSFWHQFQKRMVVSKCPLAESSQIYVDITNNKTEEYFYTLKPEPTREVTFMRGEQELRYAVYDVAELTSNNRLLSVGAKYNTMFHYRPVEPPMLYAKRFQTGYGQDKGGITCLLYNKHPTRDISVIYMEVIPWFLRTYLHSLKIEYFTDHSYLIGVNGTTIEPDHVYFVPGRERQRPYHLELVLTLPASSVTRISFDFERALLKWTEYPPDANHGFYVNSAIISAVIPQSAHYTATPRSSSKISSIMSDKSTSFFVRLHTETLLIVLPTPDFSMPYNVICLACTVVAIAFGSIHNLTTRRFVVRDPKKKGLLGRIKERVLGLVGRKKKDTNTADSGEEKLETVQDLDSKDLDCNRKEPSEKGDGETDAKS